MNKELEEAVKYLKIIKDTELLKAGYVYGTEAIETVLNYIENSIPKKVIEEKIKELEDLLDLCKTDGRISKYKIKALEKEIGDFKELLEEK